jgi:hypothetical protein
VWSGEILKLSKQDIGKNHRQELACSFNSSSSHLFDFMFCHPLNLKYPDSESVLHAPTWVHPLCEWEVRLTSCVSKQATISKQATSDLGLTTVLSIQVLLRPDLQGAGL